MKKIKDNPLMQIFILLGTIVAIILFLILDSFVIAPKRITRRNETLSNLKIPRQMDGINMMFFSDLEYGTFLKESRLETFVNAVRNTSPDIIVFGGDLYENDAQPDEESAEILKAALKSMKAPLGKFAVLGDNDQRNDETKTAVRNILESSGFEILDNRSVLLHNMDSQSITLVGLDNGLNGMQDIPAAYSNVSSNSYVITVCHTPDTAGKVPADLTDYFLSGHSHGGQVYYIFGSTYTPAMATEYLRGKHNISDAFTLDITNGVGTAVSDERFLSNAEFVIYTLRSEAPLPTPVPSLTPEPSQETAAPAETPVSEETQQTPAETEAAETPAEQAPAETPAEQTTEETPPAETPVEEIPAEETPAEETPEAQPEQTPAETGGEEASDTTEEVNG